MAVVDSCALQLDVVFFVEPEGVGLGDGHFVLLGRSSMAGMLAAEFSFPVSQVGFSFSSHVCLLKQFVR